MKDGDAAVLLALPVPGADPLDDLAGLPLALRAALTLQKEGAVRLLVIVAEGDRKVGPLLSGDARIRGRLEVRAAPSAAEGLAGLHAAFATPVLVARHDRLVDPALYRALAAGALDAKDGPLAVVAVDGSEPVGPFAASPAWFEAFAAAPLCDLDAYLGGLLAAGRAVPLPAGARWHARASTAAGRAAAVRALFEACRKPVDGMVSRHLNRHVSIFLSKRLVRTPLTPNHMSGITFLLALGAAVEVSRGGYWPMLAGALLFQANSILDGVDGELARVRFQQSRLGQWLDTVSDDLSSLLFYGGLVLGVRGLPFERELTFCGYGTLVALLLTMAQYYPELVRRGSGDFYAIEWKIEEARGLAGKVARFFQLLLKKDLFIFFYLVLAVFGVLPFALPVALLGHGIALGAATVRNVVRLRTRPALAR
jgi:phosphatidylglycerophosphate synthase